MLPPFRLTDLAPGRGGLIVGIDQSTCHVAVQFGIGAGSQFDSEEPHNCNVWVGPPEDLEVIKGRKGEWPPELGGLQVGRAVMLTSPTPSRGLGDLAPDAVGYARAWGEIDSGELLVLCDFPQQRKWVGAKSDLVVDERADALRPMMPVQ